MVRDGSWVRWTMPVAGPELDADGLDWGCWLALVCAGVSCSPRVPEKDAINGVAFMWVMAALVCGCPLRGAWWVEARSGTCASVWVAWWEGCNLTAASEGADVRRRLRGGCPGKAAGV